VVGATEAVGPAVTGRDVLRNRSFAVYVVAAAVSNAGSFMQGLSVAFVLHDLTGSNTWVGVGAFAWMVPSLLMGPPSGIVADRADRRHVLIWANLVQLAAAAALWLLAATGHLAPWPIVGLVTVAGLGAGFQYTASQSLAAVILPPAQLLQGIRLNAMGFTAARAIGPACAGVVLDRWGAEIAFLLNALSFVVMLVALAVIHTRPVATTSPIDGWWARYADGVRYVVARPALRLIVVTACVTGFFGQSMMQLAAGLADEVFDVGGDGLGLLVAMYGLGSTAASTTLVVGADRLRRSRMARTGITLFACGLALAACTEVFVVGLLGFAVAGTAHSLTNVSLNTAVQSQVHEEYRGRVLSMFLMALLAGMPFGTLAGGALGDLVGLRVTFGGFAACLFAYVLFVTTRRGGLTIIDREGPSDAPVLGSRVHR
jgi:MFS family permease